MRKRILIPIAAFAVSALLSLAAIAAITPNVNYVATRAIRSSAGTFQIGAGVVSLNTPNASDPNATNVAAPTVGGMVSLVVIDAACTTGATTKGVQVKLSNARLRAGASVSENDLVKIVDTNGRWGPATAGDKNTYYRAVQTVSTGSLFWAIPAGAELP